jgi:HSP20 family protein
VTHSLKQSNKENKMSYYINNSYNKNNNAWSSLLEDLFSDSLFDTVESKRRANIISREKEIEIQLECPGIAKEHIELSCENGVLKVTCKSPQQKEEKYLHQQFEPRESTNLFTLKNELDTNKIKASNKDGILYINIPRKQQKTKRIEIS